MKQTILDVKDLSMQFGGVLAVNDLSLHVDEGEIVALIGPNGAGKTTAFNMITGVYHPVNGQISFMGKVLAEGYPTGKLKKSYVGEHQGRYKKLIQNTPDRITEAGIARTFQNIRLFKQLSVFENVLIAKHGRMEAGFFSSVFGLNHKEEAQMRKESLELLEMVGLESLALDIADNLPYGKQRHLEIARALATKPKLLLLDEPAAGMNPQETEELADFIVKVKKDFDLTILVIEHHMNLVMNISDRIYCIDFGRLIADGVPEEIQNNAAVIQAYLGVEE